MEKDPIQKRWVSPNEQMEHSPSFYPEGELHGPSGREPGFYFGGRSFRGPEDPNIKLTFSPIVFCPRVIGKIVGKDKSN